MKGSMTSPDNLRSTVLAMYRIACLLFIGLTYCAETFSVVETYEFQSELERQRYYKFIEELRCPKCDNQNLLGSNSDIAKDLRRTLYQLLQEGQSDQEIVDFMVSRYGDFVLYRPPLKQTTLLLWLTPFILLLIGILIFAVILLRRGRAKATGYSDNNLSDQERERLEGILKQRNLD